MPKQLKRFRIQVHPTQIEARSLTLPFLNVKDIWVDTCWGMRDAEADTLPESLTLKQAQAGIKKAVKHFPEAEYRLIELIEKVY